MSSTPIRGFGAMIARLAEPEEAVTPRAAIDRAALEALDSGLDSAEAAEAFPPTALSDARGAMMATDRVRLPPPPSCGRHLGRAARRILSADLSAASTRPDQLRAEARMRHALGVIAKLVDFVHLEAAQKRGR